MKRHFYTLLLATALSLPAAGAFATGLSGSSSSSSTSSVGSTGALGDSTIDTRSDVGANADVGAESSIGTDLETGTDFGSDLDRRAETGIGTDFETDNELGMNDDTGIGSDIEADSELGMNQDTGIEAETDRRFGSDTPPGARSTSQRAGAGDPSARSNTNMASSEQLDLQTKLDNDSDQVLAPQELSSSEVRGVQSVLENRGYYQGNIDGLWGPKTAQALQSFQSDYDLQRTGQLDAQTVNRLSMAADNSSLPRTPGQTGNPIDGSAR